MLIKIEHSHQDIPWDTCNSGHRLIFDHFGENGCNQQGLRRKTLPNGRYYFWCRDCYREFETDDPNGDED
jgi:hypothetical protein